MVTTHFNHSFSGGIPISVADRYYGQDRARDFWHNLERAGRALYDFYGASNVLISGGVASQGSSVTKLNVTAAVALGPYTVTVPDSFATLPPTTKTVTLPAVLIDMVAQVDFNLSTAGATLNGSTVNYLKLAYSEANGNTRTYAKKSGTYAYEVTPSYTLTCTSVAPTSDEVLLATLTGNGSSTLTITKQVMPKNAQTLKDQVCPVGTYRFEAQLISPSEQYPWLCLDTIEATGAATVSTANWDAAFVTYLRGHQSAYRPGRVAAQTNFVSTAWNVTSNVGTLTMSAVDAGTKAFMAAMMEWQAQFSSYSNWACITVPTTIGNIPAGDYAITSMTSTQIVFAVTASNGSGTANNNVTHYPFRIAGSAITARVYGGAGVALMSPNDTNDLFISGIPRRGYGQGHVHSLLQVLLVSGVSGYTIGPTGASTTFTGLPYTDGSNGTPRMGPETHPPTLPGHLYIFGRNYLS